MPAFDIGSFKTFFDGGARPYLFYCKLTIPNITLANSYVYVKSTSLPGSDIDEQILSYNGFEYKVHGKRSYSDWAVTFISDKRFLLRSSMETWMDSISHPLYDYASIGDKTESQTFIPLDYDGSFVFRKGNQQPNVINIIDAWPKSVGPIEFDYSTQDVAQFEVLFSYKYYELSTQMVEMP